MIRLLRVFFCQASTALALSVFLCACKTQTTISTAIPTVTPTQAYSIGSTMISNKDGMTLLYVPAGNFIMGAKAEEALAVCQNSRSDCQLSWFIGEAPPHKVYLDAFWIDQTEVTNAMYTKCVEAGICQPPLYSMPGTDYSYKGDYPVGFVGFYKIRIGCFKAQYCFVHL